tara:strand:+ start:532 stop:1044 length:513 start_codon:yes stop_codon:yes gene_type:complete
MEVRCVRADEWELMKRIRDDAFHDPSAVMAFSGPQDLVTDSVWQVRAEMNSETSLHCHQYVGVVDGKFVGTATVVYQETTGGVKAAKVSAVYVSPEWRGSGLVGQLLDAAALWAERYHRCGLVLVVREENSRAVAAYRKHGFRETGRKYRTVEGVEVEMVRPRGVRRQPQ